MAYFLHYDLQIRIMRGSHVGMLKLLNFAPHFSCVCKLTSFFPSLFSRVPKVLGVLLSENSIICRMTNVGVDHIHPTYTQIIIGTKCENPEGHGFQFR